MNKLIPAHFIEPITNLITRRIMGKAWLYWPPGPMAGQVFDRDKCREEVADLIESILKEKQGE